MVTKEGPKMHTRRGVLRETKTEGDRCEREIVRTNGTTDLTIGSRH